MSQPCYYEAFYRFVKRLKDHIGTGPYTPIPSDVRRQYVQELKDELDAWCDKMDGFRREARG